jgi:uncharacterized protein (UPF0332 family)/predicted nucleotidyltransferase
MVGKNKNLSNIKASSKDIPTLKIVNERDIAFDFGTKVYRKFDKLIKSVILFGSTAKNNRTLGSDIDIIIIVDDATIKFDSEMITWYREELRKLVESNPYKSELHINTVKLTTWWNDLLHGDPVVINIIRYGEPMLDFGGFFNPLKILLEQGKIKPTPEAIYNCLQRAPQHLARSKQAELSSVEGVYWAMVDSAHALLIAAGLMPPSPEHIPIMLKENFVDKRILESEYISWFREAYILHKEILHGQIKDIKGQNLDQLQERADKFLRRMAELIESYIK